MNILESPNSTHKADTKNISFNLPCQVLCRCHCCFPENAFFMQIICAQADKQQSEMLFPLPGFPYGLNFFHLFQFAVLSLLFFLLFFSLVICLHHQAAAAPAAPTSKYFIIPLNFNTEKNRRELSTPKSLIICLRIQ